LGKRRYKNWANKKKGPYRPSMVLHGKKKRKRGYLETRGSRSISHDAIYGTTGSVGVQRMMERGTGKKGFKKKIKMRHVASDLKQLATRQVVGEVEEGEGKKDQHPVPLYQRKAGKNEPHPLVVPQCVL